jgi:hypothetical protein
VRWNSPFYGTEATGWFRSVHVLTRCVKVTCFAGPSLVPVRAGGTRMDARWHDIHEGGYDEAQFAAWIQQARSLRGWKF